MTPSPDADAVRLAEYYARNETPESPETDTEELARALLSSQAQGAALKVALGLVVDGPQQNESWAEWFAAIRLHVLNTLSTHTLGAELLAELERLRGNQRTPETLEVCEVCHQLTMLYGEEGCGYKRLEDEVDDEIYCPIKENAK